jgi:hypothetical protein
VTERLERVGERRAVHRPRQVAHEEDRRDESDRHQRGDAEEGPAPADPAELAAHERAECDADAERGLVEDDRARESAGRRRDDHRE